MQSENPANGAVFSDLHKQRVLNVPDAAISASQCHVGDPAHGAPTDPRPRAQTQM